MTKKIALLLVMCLAGRLALGAEWVQDGDNRLKWEDTVQPATDSRTAATTFQTAGDFRVTLASGGHLALSCSSSDAATPVTAYQYEYSSDRFGSGDEFLFMSRSHYGSAEQLPNIVCNVHNNGTEPAPYTLTVELVDGATLAPSEEGAAGTLYSTCCSLDNCARWDDSGAGSNLCLLKGSFCNAEGKLVRLDMAGVGLECEFPAAFANFTALEELYLQDNEIYGNFDAIAATLSTLGSLAEVKLSDNQDIEGTLDALCQGPLGKRLTLLEVAGLGLAGALPGCLFEAGAQLLRLDASFNTLDGALPEFASPLMHLDLSNNSISGTVPESLAGLASLLRLDLSVNAFSGALPDTWSAASNLEVVGITDNRLRGAVPASLASLASLQLLALSGNELSAWDASNEQTGQATSLTHLGLEDNLFEDGVFPEGVLHYPSLIYLNISNSGLGGALPEVPAGTLQKLMYLDLSDNRLTGTISESWGGVGMFGEVLDPNAAPPVFDLSYNELSGDVPAFLGVTQAGPVVVRLDGMQFANGCDPEFGDTGAACTGGSPAPVESPSPSESPAPPSPSPSPEPTSGSGSDLSGGAIAGIVISVLVACVIVAGFIIYAKRKRQQEGAAAAGVFGTGAGRFQKFEEDEFTRPTQDVELPGRGYQQQHSTGRQQGYPYQPESP